MYKEAKEAIVAASPAPEPATLAALVYYSKNMVTSSFDLWVQHDISDLFFGSFSGMQ